MLLGVNIDHVATLRQARYALLPDSPNAEPSPLQAALDAQAGGADSITIHVRADRRHMQDRDAFEIRQGCPLPLNLEMGVTAEMTELALQLKPEFACLVPETREEVTTEGGLDVAGRLSEVKACVATLQQNGIRVSLFIDPDLHQIEAAAATGAEMVELHTGCFANATGAALESEIARLKAGAIAGQVAGIQVNAGHGINYLNLRLLDAVPHLTELNIGHSIVSRAMRVGFTQAVAEMKALMAVYPES
ncbi:pyridoxine 5'-phosphate synthase [Luteolibacter sp. GHJ8]|uniref:Pyridoxine 5'-phosphate synthase n=1 Tax=Luteolibacter rhizosphaerae TaxID=2989719 RepID=A0ABT3G2U7_9BACT|nr:pyridoxine 5'-phosphate synthase [Luteolibacter rhizosphaerae]MCW1913982.1 pyridoxine 5'-phosphate synthase [Luteolibacter rhizosphaerae]